MKKTLILSIVLMSAVTLSAQTKRISVEQLRDKIAGAWIGQMVGNIYGLPYENKFIEQPGDESQWPWGYAKSLQKMEQYDGAFSDDDTDFEYIYLTLMEKYGSEPTYAQMRDGWMYHVRDRVWLANRAALGLMHYGYTPPFTGSMESNPHWYQIDPQLINEIWAYTAPGMTAYAAEKSAWAARITSDSWAISPTVHYGAMYAMAFFDNNIERVVTRAVDFLPADDRYAQTVRECVALYKQYPKDWVAARQVIAKKYYVEEPAMTKTIWNANLNGAMGVLALLYGGGDWQRTMDIGVSMGFDADNQTATIGGILGVMYGTKPIPEALSNPFGRWDLPFNDSYINITRYDMPDASIQDMIDRTVKMAVELVSAKGGKVFTRGGKQYLQINTEAQFSAPLEFCVGPAPRMEQGKAFEYDFACATNRGDKWAVASGVLPEGVQFEGGRLSGTPVKAGKYPVTLTLSRGKQSISKEFVLVVRGRNIAPEAEQIIANVKKTNMEVLKRSWITFGEPMYADTVSVINDGVLNGAGSVFYSLAAAADLPKIDYFGYSWSKPHTIDMIGLHTGCLEEFGGWFSSLSIQYRTADGRWKDVGDYTSTPALPSTDEVFFQPHFVEYLLEFTPVETTAVRVLLDTKVQEHWNKPTKGTSAFTSITELSVYENQ